MQVKLNFKLLCVVELSNAVVDEVSEGQIMAADIDSLVGGWWLVEQMTVHFVLV